MAPLFSTFDEAWAWFTSGGALTPIAEQREAFLRGRGQFLSLQVPVADMPVADDVAAMQELLSDIEGLSLTPPELLHISIRGIGFQVIAKHLPGDVLRQDVGAIGERAGRALRGAAAVDVAVGPVNVFPDALILQVEPVEPLRGILRRLDMVGTDDAFPYPAERYLPHITIATFLDPASAGTLRRRLPPVRETPPVAAAMRRVDLVRWWFTGHDSAAWPELETLRSFRLS